MPIFDYDDYEYEDEEDTSDMFDYGFNDEDNNIETFTDLVENYEDSI